jgi:carbon storage regulator
MLVLTRKPGQSIIIGDEIEVQVLSVAGEKVRLGITAPRDVGIFRNEVYERIENGETRRSTNGAVDSELERLSSRS